jgi:hypothetical protein
MLAYWCSYETDQVGNLPSSGTLNTSSHEYGRSYLVKGQSAERYSISA